MLIIILPAWSHSPIFCGLRGTPEQLKYQDMISKSISKSLEDYSEFLDALASLGSMLESDSLID